MIEEILRYTLEILGLMGTFIGVIVAGVGLLALGIAGLAAIVILPTDYGWKGALLLVFGVFPIYAVIIATVIVTGNYRGHWDVDPGEIKPPFETNIVEEKREVWIGPDRKTYMGDRKLVER